MPERTAALELLPAPRWPSRVKRSDTLEKFFKGVATFQGIEQKLEGYSRPAKNGRSAQDIRIFDDHAVPGTHKVSITDSVALSSRRWLESYTVTANSLPRFKKIPRTRVYTRIGCLSTSTKSAFSIQVDLRPEPLHTSRLEDLNTLWNRFP